MLGQERVRRGDVRKEGRCPKLITREKDYQWLEPSPKHIKVKIRMFKTQNGIVWSIIVLRRAN